LSFWWEEGVEGSSTIASKNHGLGEKILHSETKCLKFNRAKVIDSELADRNNIFIMCGTTRMFRRYMCLR
jgi:hypothetical protein